MVFMLYRFIKWTFECFTMGHRLTPSLRESSKGKSQFEVVNSEGKSPRNEGKQRGKL